MANAVKRQIAVRKALDNGQATADRAGMWRTVRGFDVLSSTLGEFTTRSVLGKTGCRTFSQEMRVPLEEAKAACRLDAGVPVEVTTAKEASEHLKSVMKKNGVFLDLRRMRGVSWCGLAAIGGIALVSEAIKPYSPWWICPLFVAAGAALASGYTAGRYLSTILWEQRKHGFGQFMGNAIIFVWATGFAAWNAWCTLKGYPEGHIPPALQVPTGIISTAAGTLFALSVFQKRLGTEAAAELKRALAAHDIFKALGRVEKELDKAGAPDT
jgi:hypothetical protein